jgi:hypothetical protein
VSKNIYSVDSTFRASVTIDVLEKGKKTLAGAFALFPLFISLPFTLVSSCQYYTFAEYLLSLPRARQL